MVEAAFRTLLVPAAGGTLLCEAGLETASQAAITLSAVAVSANEEERTTMGSPAKPLPEGLLRGRSEQHEEAQWQSLDMRRLPMATLRYSLRVVASATGPPKRKTPVAVNNRGCSFYCVLYP